MAGLQHGHHGQRAHRLWQSESGSPSPSPVLLRMRVCVFADLRICGFADLRTCARRNVSTLKGASAFMHDQEQEPENT